jgi:crotonobetainyl-CoA:carnitine CoA-transferase CaiB-like acyl-CoA transferase
LAIAEQRGLPVSAVHDAAAAGRDAVFADAGVTEQMSLPGGGAQTGVGPWLPDAGRTPAGPAPLLGEHTDAVLTELE